MLKRLIGTTRGARKRSKKPGPVEHNDLQILRLIDEGTAAQTGVAFFREFVTRLAHALDSRYAFVSRFDAANTRAHVIALWDGASLQEGMEYPLPGSPCENVLDGDIVAFDSDIAELFPVERKELEAMGAQSYLAIPLKSMAGRVIGHLAVIDTRPRTGRSATSASCASSPRAAPRRSSARAPSRKCSARTWRCRAAWSWKRWSRKPRRVS